MKKDPRNGFYGVRWLDTAFSPGRPGAPSSSTRNFIVTHSPAPTAPGRRPQKRRQAGALQKAIGLFLALALCGIFVPSLQAHHFKGLPHYNYFENYPQVPEEEFLGQAGSYEFSLVVYDFQGIKRDKVETPDNVRLFLVIFNLRNNAVYGGPLTLEVLDRGQVVHAERHDSSELENLYSMHRELPDTGKYALRITLHDENALVCNIPFTLSSQKVHWGKGIGGALLLLIVVAAIGARRARVKLDRKAEARHRAAEKQKAST